MPLSAFECYRNETATLHSGQRCSYWNECINIDHIAHRCYTVVETDFKYSFGKTISVIDVAHIEREN